MTIYRYKKNGLLYTIHRVSPMRVSGHWYEAHPYRHSTEIGITHKNRFRQFRSNMSLEDFVPVAER